MQRNGIVPIGAVPFCSFSLFFAQRISFLTPSIAVLLGGQPRDDLCHEACRDAEAFCEGFDLHLRSDVIHTATAFFEVCQQDFVLQHGAHGIVVLCHEM